MQSAVPRHDGNLNSICHNASVTHVTISLVLDYQVPIARCQVGFLVKNTTLMIPYTYILLFVRMSINIPPNSSFFNNAHNFIAENCNFTEVMIMIYHN